jgi:hypothetical protein
LNDPTKRSLIYRTGYRNVQKKGTKKVSFLILGVSFVHENHSLAASSAAPPATSSVRTGTALAAPALRGTFAGTNVDAGTIPVVNGELITDVTPAKAGA